MPAKTLPIEWTLLLSLIKFKLIFVLFLPLLAKIKFNISKITHHKLVIKLPLKRINKNYYHSLYFGAQTMMAEALPYLYIYQIIKPDIKQYHIVTQSFESHFYHKADRPLYLSLKQSPNTLKHIFKSLNKQPSKHSLTFVINGFCFKDHRAQRVSQFIVKLHIKSKVPPPSCHQ